MRKRVGPLVVGVLSLALLLAAACGGGGGGPAPTNTPTTAPENTPTSAPPASTATATSPAPANTPTTVTGAPTSAVPPSDNPLVAKGLELFMNVPDNAAPQALWCSTCHLIEGVSEGLVGPDQTHIGTDAATRRPGLSAEEYIRESIKSPEVFIPEGVERSTAGLMTNAITENLTEEQIDALVAFLLTRK